MSVTTDVAVSGGTYIPFRTARRGGVAGRDAVGTLSVDIETVGNGTGGTVTLGMTMARGNFGFHALWVPTRITVVDTLATAEVVVIAFVSAGNDRLRGPLDEAVLSIDRGDDRNIGVAKEFAILIDPGSRVEGQVLSALWQSNTDTKSYHLHAYGAIYDAEIIAREGGVSELVAGLR